MNYEKPQRHNPNELTIRQHVIPARSLKRFSNLNGFVQVSLEGGNKTLSLKPSNDFFTLARVWDQRAESGWMKKIEDQFQPLADDILSGRLESIVGEQIRTVAYFFSLWHWRSRQAAQIAQDVQLHNAGGASLTKDEEEKLEKRHILFSRSGGRMPARFLTGLQLQKFTDQYTHQIKDWTWGIIHAPYGEFLMPDVPSHNILPISPKVVIAANHSNGIIRKENLKNINISLMVYTWNYFVARDVKTAVAGISKGDLRRAVKMRDTQLARGERPHGPIAAAGDR